MKKVKSKEPLHFTELQLCFKTSAYRRISEWSEDKKDLAVPEFK